MEERQARMTGQEKFYSCNSLVCLLQALKGHTTTVELRNEAEVYGTIDNVDGFMNITVSGAVFTDPAGSRAPFDAFFVHGRQIRYVHIPDEVSPLSAMRRQLQRNQTGRGGRAEETEQMKRSRRTKKAQAYTRDTVRSLNRPGPPAAPSGQQSGQRAGQQTGQWAGQQTGQRAGQQTGQASARRDVLPSDDSGFV